MIADGVLFGLLEANGKTKRDARPWVSASKPRRARNIATDLAAIAQRSGAAVLAPILEASPDGPLVGRRLDIGAEIERQRAEVLATGRVH